MLGSSSAEGIQLPIGDMTAPGGYAAPASIQTDFQTKTRSESQHDREAVSKLAAKALDDPLLLRQLSDRVYELMLEDLRYQKERSRNYGR